MAGTIFSLQICNNITNEGIVDLTVVLYDYPVSISVAGVITGTVAQNSEGSNLNATELGGGVYQFSDVPSGKYTIVMGSENVTSQKVLGYDGIEIINIETVNEIITFLRANAASLPEGTLPETIPSGS